MAGKVVGMYQDRVGEIETIVNQNATSSSPMFSVRAQHAIQVAGIVSLAVGIFQACRLQSTSYCKSTVQREGKESTFDGND